MNPGFRNFEPVSAGQILGQDRSGDVVSPEGGHLLLPLYQPKGDDGFFLTREVHTAEFAAPGPPGPPPEVSPS